MNDQQKRQLAKEIERRAAVAPPPMNMELLEARMEQAALRGKARRPSQVLLAKLSELFSYRAVRFAVPALCCALLVFGILSMMQTDLPFQPYSAASLPPAEDITRGDEQDFVWPEKGWSENAVLDDYTLKESIVGSAATADSTQQLMRLTCVYTKGESTVEITVSEGPLPLWAVLSAGQSKEMENIPVFFGRDHAGSSCAAVWQHEGLSFSVTTNEDADELLRIVKTVLRWK